MDIIRSIKNTSFRLVKAQRTCFVAPTGIEPVYHAWEACILTIRWKRQMRKLGDSNPRYGKPVRQFSKLVVSATHPNFLSVLHLFLKCDAKLLLIFRTSKFSGRNFCVFAGISGFAGFSWDVYRPPGIICGLLSIPGQSLVMVSGGVSGEESWRKL